MNFSVQGHVDGGTSGDLSNSHFSAIALSRPCMKKTSLADPKMQLRKTMRSRRRVFTARQQNHIGRALLDQLTSYRPYYHARRVAFYLSSDGEIEPDTLISHALKNAKTCYLPVLHPLKHNRLHFVRYQASSTLVANRFGIREPRLSSHHLAPPWTLDIIFMPLVAFDRSGIRLGMGGGYYDRTLANMAHNSKPLLIGLAHSCQEVDCLESSPWDIPMNAIATEKELIITDKISQ